MKTNYTPKGYTRFYEVDNLHADNIFTIVGGAAGWIDTDISASDVPAGAVAIHARVIAAAAQDVGARYPGSVGNYTGIGGGGATYLIFRQTTARHVEFYRSAANNVYYICGYEL